MATAADALRAKAAQLIAPLVIVTATDGHRTAGCVVGFHTQVSIDPLRFAVCIAHVNHTATVAADAEALSVHYLESHQRDLAVRFGSETGDDTDKFRGVPVHRTVDPAAVELTTVAFRWTGTVDDAVDCGDHTLYVLSPSTVQTPSSFTQLSNTDVDIDTAHPLP